VLSVRANKIARHLCFNVFYNPPRDHFWPNFAFFSLEHTALRLHAKFELSRFNRSRDNRGSQNSKSGSGDPIWPFWLNFAFFSLVLNAFRLGAKFEASSFNRFREIRRSKNSNSESGDHHVTLSPNFAFFGYISLASVSMPHLKFLASTVPERLWGPRIMKLGHMTPTWPLLT